MNHDYEELKKASPETKQEKVKALVDQVQHLLNKWEEKEQGWRIYYSYAQTEYSSRIRDFLDTCPESKERKEVIKILDKIDKLHRDFIERMSNH